jgi:hypothetical protein
MSPAPILSPTIDIVLALAISFHGRPQTYLSASQSSQIILILDGQTGDLYYSQLSGDGTRSPIVFIARVANFTGTTSTPQTYLASNNCLWEWFY